MLEENKAQSKMDGPETHAILDRIHRTKTKTNKQKNTTQKIKDKQHGPHEHKPG